MDSLKHFILPLTGLYEGDHHYKLFADKSFFLNFENSPVLDGNVDIDLEVDKRPNFFELRFKIDGFVATECDRCTAEINIPVSNDYKVLLKMEEARSDSDKELDVIYLSSHSQFYNTANLAYEIICLALPMIKTVDCEELKPQPCDLDVLDLINGSEEKSESNTGSIWSDLKNLNLD